MASPTEAAKTELAHRNSTRNSSQGERASERGPGSSRAESLFMRSDRFELAAYKGAPLSFRSWDGQLRQPILLADAHSLVSVSPQPGFLHQFSEFDTLGIDKPESKCRSG